MNETITGQELKSIPSYISLSLCRFSFKFFKFSFTFKIVGDISMVQNSKCTKRHSGKSLHVYSQPGSLTGGQHYPLFLGLSSTLCFILYYVLYKFGLGFFFSISRVCSCKHRSACSSLVIRGPQNKSFLCKVLLCKVAIAWTVF